MEKDSRFFVTSVTKLYVTAVVMQLIEENRLTLSDKKSNHLTDDFCKGLYVLNGVDYSDEITITHLMSNTSGLRDYF